MAVDPKAAPLADDLRELALSLPTNVFPKAFFCALCSEIAIDSYKLLCCNKAICATCQAKLSFPTTCPSCDHSPLEADSCAPNKALRNTMRVWLQKQKKKEEAKVAAQAATSAPEAKSPEIGGPVVAEGADKPIDSVEVAATAGDAPIESAAVPVDAEDGKSRTVSASAQPKEDSAAPGGHDSGRRAVSVSQTATQSVEPSAVNASSNEQNKTNDDTDSTGNNPVMSGMQNQMGFGFQGQGNFGGMGFNGMPNMMGNTWNNMNPMDFNMNNMNNMNNMYNNFGGNMGMAMGDMSAMNMMNYGGGYGNGWNGIGGGYGNFNGFNQMGGYNQSGGYPEMMNQFPKNNFQNQNQNRFPASQGGALPQQNNRAGSHGGSVSGPGGVSSRPGSRGGPAQNVRRSHESLPGQPFTALKNMKPAADDSTPQQRDGESSEASADAVADSKPGDGQDTIVQSTEEGRDQDDSAQESATAADNTADSEVNTKDTTITGDQDQTSTQSNGLSQIQTVGSEDADVQAYDQSMMSNGIVPNMSFANGMMNQFPNQMQMNAPFNSGMNMGFHQNNSFGPRGSFNAAYGAATVLTGEPQGRGVEGAPTGPRAMREGRPNTGFSSRMNNTRYQPPPPPLPKSVTPAQSVGARSPQRRVRSRSPQRDETLRTRDKSVTRSRSRSQPKDDEKGGRRERSRSADGEPRREDRGRSVTPQGDADLERRNDYRPYRSSRDDDRGDKYDDRTRDDRGSRGDRTRSVSVDSKYRSSRRDKEKHRSSRSHRDRSKEHRRRHRSRSPVEKGRYDDDSYANGDQESESSSRRRHRADKDKHRERSRERSRDKERERDRRDRREKGKDYDYERDKDRIRDKDKERRRRRDREAEEDNRDCDDDRYRSARRSRKDRDRDARDRDDRSRDDRRDSDRDAKKSHDAEDDVVGKMMQKRATSPPLNAPTGPSANTFSIKGAGRSKTSVMPPPQPPTGPRGFQPPKGPAADRDKERHGRKSSASSVVSTPGETISQDHYAAERERNARERNSRDRVDRDQRDVLSKSLHSRIHSASRSSISSKRSRDEDAEVDEAARESTKTEIKVPTGPASHRDKRRKSGAGGDNSIANLFTAGLRKNAGKTRRGGVRTEGDVEREMERVERERDRR